MRHKVLRILAVASALGLGIAACSSSVAKPRASVREAPLVVANSAGLPFTKSFSPYGATPSTGILINSTALYYEPLLMFDVARPTEPPTPWLATGFTWSDGGKTLTLGIRQGVRWNDGKPFTANDVAFTFNLLKDNPSLTPADPPPPIVSATAPSQTTAVLKFYTPEYGRLADIGGVFIMPQHIWQHVKNPATYADAAPVGTGPFTLSQFSAQKITFTRNRYYWQPAKVSVPEVVFANYPSNGAIVKALQNDQVDWADTAFTDAKQGAPSGFGLWSSAEPWFYDNNVVTLWLNVTKAPLNDPEVRLAISAGIDRQQVSAQGEGNAEPPATSSSGLLLPTDDQLLDPAYSEDIQPSSDPAKVSSILTADGWTKVNGKWRKGGKIIKFAIEDPTAYNDYTMDAQLIAKQLNAEGFDVSFTGVQVPAWFADFTIGHFDAMLQWSNQGSNPLGAYAEWLDDELTSPVGKPAIADYGRFMSPQAVAALGQYSDSNDPAVRQRALAMLQRIVSTQAPVIPLVYGAAWYEFSTRNYTGWPTQANPYTAPSLPTYMLATLLHLKPVS